MVTGGIAPRFLNGTRWRWVVRSTYCLL